MSASAAFWIASVAVLAPFLAGLAALARRERASSAAAPIVGALVSLGAGSWLLASPPAGSRTVSVDWVAGLGLSVSWRLETAPLALAVLVAGVGALVLHYAAAYFAGQEVARRALAFMSFFLATMLGLVLAGDLYLLFVFWELTGIFSFLLIGLDRSSDEAWSAARQALLVTVGGGLSLLVGVVWIDRALGTTRLSDLGPGSLDPATASVALALILPAVLTKSAQLPFSTWLPRAMAAPTPASALLHSATMVKAGIILLLYLAPALRVSPLWSAVLVPAGAATCVWGAYRALTVFDLKRLLAYSTVSQLGLLTLTAGLGTDVALRAAVLHLFAHAVFKAGLFVTVGSVERATGTRDLERLGGLRRAEPALFVFALLLAGSMAGIPPLAGFLSKELILKKAMLGEAWVHGVAITGIVIGSIGTVAYSARLVFGTFLGRARGPRGSGRDVHGTGELVAPAVFAAVTLAAGLAAPWVDLWFLEPVAASLVGTWLGVKPLSLWYGLEVAFLLSVAIVTAGWWFHRGFGLRLLVWPDWIRPVELAFDRLLEAVAGLGRAVEGIVAKRSPTVYYATVATLAVAAIGAGLRDGVPLPALPDSADLGLVVLLAAGVAVLLLSGTRFGRVLALSGVGLAVALLFRRLAAPDLMLTQVSVEVLTTVLFAAAVVRLPRRAEGVGRSLSKRRLAFSVVGGGALALLALGIAGAPAAALATPDFVGQAPARAAGANVVNVILTDFRGIDTLVETFVIAVAAVGAIDLLARSTRPGKGKGVGGLLPVAMPWIGWLGILLAAALLVKGHDQPGGGFVAGLVAAVIWIAAFLATPDHRPRRSLERGLRWGVVGLAAALLWPLAGGLAPLSHLHGKIAALGVKWHSALVFEVAIAATVACAVTLAVHHLWRGRSA